MIDFLAMGGVLGLAAGLSPGPLLTLVITETLRHGAGAGVKVALAPVVTDLPIILGVFYLLRRWADFEGLLGVLSLVGGLFVVYLAADNLRAQNTTSAVGEEGTPRPLLKGVMANALNPHPYLFWVTVGTPQVVKALNLGAATLAGFLGSFYACLLGAKVLLALLAGRSRRFLAGRAYLFTLRALGLLLIGLAAILFHDGLKLLGWL
ncbi:MAG: LysE family transporter [Pseudomonadota bacterium]|nr:LysE family transporter [Pseudomonadota bacterium]